MHVYLVRFMDSAGIDWRVQEQPETPHTCADAGAANHPRRLRFESILGVRYLSPVPECWDELPPRILELLCSVALERERAA